tara:strand:+ start:1080 stop:2819 length:1740 start_codon:yes stop_codon:yes gene_type:complete
VSASPADFELYSRVTGTPLPRTPQEQMQMAPMVHHFTRNYARQPQQPNFFQETAENLGKLALLGLAGGAVYGLARQGGQKTPEMPSTGQVGTVNSATVDLNPAPPTSITEEEANAMSPSELSGEYRNLANTTSDPALKEVYNRSADRQVDRSNALTTTPNTDLVEDPWDDSNVSVMPREVQKSPIGQAVSGQIERIRSQGGGRDLRTAAPGLAGAIALRGVVPGLSGGGLGVGEGGALGQGAVSGFWGGVKNLPVVSQAVEGLENVGNMGIFGNTLGNAASTVFQGVPGLQEGANVGAVKLAELGGLGAGVFLDSAVKDTLTAGANARRFIDPSGKMVPTVGQTVNFHNQVLVPGGKRMAGAVFNAVSTSEKTLPTSATQASGNLLEGSEPQVTRHPDVPPGETDQAPSRGGNIFSNLAGSVRNAWDENTRVAEEIALENELDADYSPTPRDEGLAFLQKYGTPEEAREIDTALNINPSQLEDSGSQFEISQKLTPDQSNKYKEVGIDNRGDLAFVFRNRSQAEPYSEKVDPREAERLSDFIKEGGFEYMSDVKPREIIDSIRSDVNTQKYVKTPEGWR